ncbi:MAG: fatty acid desaturase [Candidatus Latescibacterota bacterium]|jgi:fatty acid desaturase
MSNERSARTIAWHRTPVERETIKALHRRSDLKAFLQVAGHLGLIALTGTIAWHVQDRLYLLLPTLLAYGTFYVFLLNATHELSHNSVFKTRAFNAFFLRLFCFFAWRNHHMFWTSHAEHHKYTLHPPDDLEVVLPRLLRFNDFLRVAFIDPWTFYATLKGTIRLALGRVEGEWEMHLFPPEAAEKRRRLLNWSRLLLAGHATLVGFSIYFGLWLLPVLTTFGVFYGGWLRFLCNHTQHTGLQDDIPDFRLCTRTVLLNPFARFLYWHMNYHIEHHMYAAVPCYNLGKLHQQIRHELPVPPRGLTAAWKEIINIIKEQQQNPAYQYTPELPTPVSP